MRRNNDFLIAILAGGEGRRMGGGKPHRPLQGKPLLAHVLAAVPADVICGGADLAGFGLPLLADPVDGAGPMAGVAAALVEAERRGLAGALTLPCDTVSLPGDLLERFSAATLPAVAVAGGRQMPTIALWPVNFLPDIMRRLKDADESHALHSLLIGAQQLVWPHQHFVNLNTPEALAGYAAGRFPKQAPERPSRAGEEKVYGR